MVVPKSSASTPLIVQSLPAPIPLVSTPPPAPSSFDPVDMQRKLVQQQAYLDNYFKTQQKWSALMEKSIHKRTRDLGLIANNLNLREKEVVENVDVSRVRRARQLAVPSSPWPSRCHDWSRRAMTTRLQSHPLTGLKICLHHHLGPFIAGRGAQMGGGG